jgi:hypothetical protein
MLDLRPSGIVDPIVISHMPARYRASAPRARAIMHHASLPSASENGAANLTALFPEVQFYATQPSKGAERSRRQCRQ